MQINDDTIRSAFAWPVRWDVDKMAIMNADGIIIDFWGGTPKGKLYADAISDYLGETIAAILNERYAPKGGSDADKG